MNPIRSLLILFAVGTALAAAEKPNIVFLLADDLGRGDLGCYGGKVIPTPNIDRLAIEGLRFSQAYAGSTVCAPSRCTLMTGQHTGHAQVRANTTVGPEGQQPLAPGTVTLASLLKRAGYATGAFGKWGLGGPGSSGEPAKAGFDDFLGYLCQALAHEYYPTMLRRQDEAMPLDGKTYSHTVIFNAALDSNGPLRGYKRDLYEGGIRVPLIARWPGRIRPGVSDHVCAFWDFLPTFAEFMGLKAPTGLDGLSFAPTLLGRTGQKKPDHLYWEFHEGGFAQAVRFGDWKALRRGPAESIELYDLATDEGETRNVAMEHPDVVGRAEGIFRTGRTDSPLLKLNPKTSPGSGYARFE